VRDAAGPSGTLPARDSASGMVLKQLSLGEPTFGGIGVTGRAVYVSVGLGPAPAPAPQQSGSGSIVAFGDTSKSGEKPGGSTGGKKKRARIALSVKPHRVRAGRWTVFRFNARAAGKAVKDARLR